MQIIMLLNQCYRFPGFVYQQARLSENRKRLEVLVRPRAGSKAICSACHRSAAASDHLAQRQFEFIPVWGFLVFSSTACAGSTAQPAALWSSKSPGPMASIPSPKPTCSFWHAGRANCPGKKPSNRSTPLGTKFATLWSTSWTGAWPIAPWIPSRPSAWTRSSMPKAKSTSPWSTKSTPRPHSLALGRQGANRRNLPGILRYARTTTQLQNPIRLLGHVEAVSPRRPRAMLPGAPHPRPLSHRSQDE